MLKGIDLCIVTKDKELGEKIRKALKEAAISSEASKAGLALVISRQEEAGMPRIRRAGFLQLDIMDLEGVEDPRAFIAGIRKGDGLFRAIFINGPRDFEALQESIRRKVAGYFTKPLALEALREAAADVIEESIDSNRREQEGERLKAASHLERLKNLEKIMRNLVDKPEKLVYLLDEINSRYGMSLKNTYYRGVVVSVDRPELYVGRYGFKNDCLMLADRIFKEAGFEVLAAKIHPYGLAAAVNLDPALQEGVFRESLLRLAFQVNKLQGHYGGFRLAIAAGRPEWGIGGIVATLEDAWRLAVEKGSREGGGTFLREDDPSREQAGAEGFALPVMLEKNFRKYVKRYDYLKLLFLFDELAVRGAGMTENKPGFSRSMLPAMMQVVEEAFDQEEEAAEWHKNKPVEALFYVFDSEVAFNRFKMALVETCDHLARRTRNERSEAVRAAAEYLNTHYNKGVTLEELARTCGLSPNYMSAKFKEEMGESYMDYLIDIRLHKAQDLLVSTDLTVKAISESIGYLDEKYFSKLFKKYYEETPSDYRRKNRES